MYIFVFIASFIANGLLLTTREYHGVWSEDTQTGTQKFHKEKTLRIGGVAIYLAILVSTFLDFEGSYFLMVSAIAGLPVFLAGLGEDVTKHISPWLRLSFAFSSAFVFIFWTGFHATSINTPILKELFQWYPFSFVITAVAIAGISNAINIIDGFNGLASGSLIIMFGTLGLLTMGHGDLALASFAFVHVMAVLGFYLWNFPMGRIFMGDGGAYYLGFALAIGVIMAFERNLTLSPWTLSLILAYPIMETMFSIYRKLRRVGYSPVQADAMHLHHLIRRSYGRRIAKRLGREDMENSLTGLIMLLFPLSSCVLALIAAPYSPYMSIAFWVVYVLIYIGFYERLSLVASRRRKTRQKKAI